MVRSKASGVTNTLFNYGPTGLAECEENDALLQATKDCLFEEMERYIAQSGNAPTAPAEP